MVCLQQGASVPWGIRMVATIARKIQKGLLESLLSADCLLKVVEVKQS